MAQLLLDHGEDVSTRTDSGVTPLHFAVSHGHASVARLLLSKGAEVSFKAGGVTPLMHAALSGHALMVLLLIQHGADLSDRDFHGRTALHYVASSGREAVAGGHDAVALLLVEHGADVSAKTKEGHTPEDLATARSKHSIAAMLRAEAGRRAQGVAGPRAGVQVACPPEARK